MGPPAAEARSQSVRFKPYVNNVTVPVANVENREPACTTDSGGTQCTEFYLVRIVGSENATLVEGPDVLKACTSSPRWLYRLDEARRRIEYNASYYQAISPTANTIVAQEFRAVVFGERSAIQGCPTSYGLFSYEKTPPPSHVKILGAFGALNTTVFRFGNVVVNKEIFFNIGDKLVVSYGAFRVVGSSTYFVQGGFEVVNLGPWRFDHLAPGTGTVQGEPH
jgi:hypothetical protein